ncbi:MAG: methionyl-tRNA formyltransferase [Primorskyibacter sp.]
MRLVFMGSPDFSVPALEALVAAGHDIAAVYCQPPRPAGRGKAPRPTPVHTRAEALGLPVRHPVSLKDTDAQVEFTQWQADAAVVVAYGLLLPQAVLDTPRLGCFNIHASLLPRWRGAAPIHRALLAGDTETGVCIMQMEAGLDTGPVILCDTTPITAQDTTADLHDRLSQMGARLMVDALTRLGDLPPQAQPDTGVTYAAKITKSEARIDWTQPASTVSRQIRGLSPFPGAWTETHGTRIKLLHATEVTGHGAPGEVLHGLTIACGQGSVRVTRAQRAGKAAQTTEAFLRGIDLPPGTILNGAGLSGAGDS